MTDSEIRTLRALEETMVKAVQTARESVQKYKAEQEAATVLSHTWVEARTMKAWAEGRLLAFTTSLNDLREAFPDELIEEEEEPQKHGVGCKCSDCKAERGDHIYHAKREEV